MLVTGDVGKSSFNTVEGGGGINWVVMRRRRRGSRGNFGELGVRSRQTGE